MMQAASKQWARRMPPMLQASAGLALLIAVFPSALHIPITGPGGQAEVAPIPGKSQQSAISALGASTSVGVGSGGTSVLPNGVAADVHGNVTVPALLRCVGDPPRQTPDPLSPPCISGWTGNNGGATYQGVSATSIKVVLYDEWAGAAPEDYTTDPIQSSDSPNRRTIKTLLRYFQTHFETYGRTVDLRLVPQTGQDTTSEVQDSRTVVQMRPFASASIDNYNENPYLAGVVQGHVVTFAHDVFGSSGEADRLSRQFLAQSSPYLWSFIPDQESVEQGTATWICVQLVGRPAAHAGDPTLQRTIRKFALVTQSGDSQGEPNLNAEARVLQEDLQRTCGLDVDFEVDDTNIGPDPLVAKLQSEGITTVIADTDESLEMAGNASTPPYRPEWIRTPDTRDADQVWERETQQLDGAPQSVFGPSWQWRVKPLNQTYWYQAYQALNSDGQFDTAFGPFIYEQLMQVFTAIQRSGPILNPPNIQTGLESEVRPGTLDNYSPPAFYAPGDHSFLHEMLLQRWDPTQVAPGESQFAADQGGGGGCYVLIGDGLLRQANDWPAGDHVNDSGECGADFSNPLPNSPNGDGA